MRKYLLALLCLACLSTYAQKNKTGVIVFGATPAGLAAAIQSAHSGVKTILADASSIDEITLSAADKAYKIGIYGDFLRRVDSLQKGKNLNNQNLLPAYTAVVFKGWADTIKNLSVIKRVSVRNIEKDGKSWQIELSDRQEIKADVVVDATSTSEVARLAGANLPTLKLSEGVYPDKTYRLAIAIINQPGVYPSGLPATRLFADNFDNFAIAGANIKANMMIGQAAGAAAAYCAFFDKKNSELDVRKVQGELVTYRSQFVKLDDISVYDTLAPSIQKIIVTGLLKAKLKNGHFAFMPDSTVSTNEIRQPMREYFSRSQIWFLDHKSDNLTIADLLNLIKFSASRGNELDKEVERNWNRILKLKGKYDPKRLVTRRELARLVDLYLKPFERSLDLEGNLTR